MILKEGDLILVAHRRLFEKDDARFFVGRVDGYDSGVVRATGHSHVRDPMSGKMVDKADARTKILSLSSGTLIVYQLPGELDFEAMKFVIEERRLILTDGKAFRMNLMETPMLGRV